MKKLKVAVIFGGRSGEHEVSLVSAASVIKALDKDKYEILEIGIDKSGKWLRGDGCLGAFKSANFMGLNEMMLSTEFDFDIAFPVLHGPFGEDGTIQGLFEMFQIPYVGCGVLASSTAMDKIQCKVILEAAGLLVVPYLSFLRREWEKNSEKIIERIKSELGVPCFVKPANMGSSVGISKVKMETELRKAINEAAMYDRKILVEKAVNVREIECALLGNDKVIASPVGEVLVGGEFYDFNDKYVNGVSKTQVPADLDEETAEKIRKICIEAYKSLDCSGLARCDAFLDRDSGDIYVNEINTMPGFTSISMYPKMMEAQGLGYSALIDKLIELGLERFQDKQKNQIEFKSGSDWYQA